MADEIAVDSFLNLLGQSDLLPDDQLLSLLESVRGEGLVAQSAHEMAATLVERQVLTAWQADMLLQGKHRGFRLGPYRILKPLGQGGMSKVFLAEHMLMHRRVAIKILPTKYQEDADLLKRFQYEAVAIAALDHPNIVRAHDFNKDVRYGKEIPYLVMEYVEGPDLRRLVDEQGPLDYRKAADFICQAAEGLAHAHAAGFVHRDIKPANLLVDPHGVLKVLDLGLATFAEAEQGLNSDEGGQSAVGTADFVAPEQIIDSRNVDGRADIYSLGHTFYYLLTGHRPFTKSTIMELLMAHQKEKPEPISKSRPDVPMDLEAIIDKMTAKSSFQRYQSAKELAQKLRTWLKESGSARAYSRISTLMAEALRGKQASTQDTTRAAATHTQDTELELAKLTEETAIPSDGGAKKAGSAEVAAQEAINEPTAGNGAAGGAKQSTSGSHPKLPSQGSAIAGKTPGGSSRKLPPVAEPRPKEELMASLPAAETLPPLVTVPGSRSHGSLRAVQKQAGFRQFLKNPRLWLGLAGGTVFLVVLTVLLVLIAYVPEKPQSDSGKDAVNASQKSLAVPKHGLEPPTANQHTSKQDKGSAQPASPKATTPVVTPKPPPVPAPSPSQPTVVQSATPPSPATDVEKTTVVPAPEPVEPQPAAPPQLPPESAVDKDALLAAVTSIAIQPAQLDLATRKIAEKAAEYLGWKVDNAAPAIMTIDLKTSKVDKSIEVVMSLELKCPAEDGKLVSVWQRETQLFKGDAKKIDLTQPRTRQLFAREVLTPKVNAVFRQFRSDVHAARDKTKIEAEVGDK